MVGRLTISTLASFSTLAAFSTLAVGAARAADYPQPIIVQQPVEEFSGWYLRGDIGFSNQSVGSISNDNYSGFDSVTNVNKDFDSAPFFGIGIGYNVNNWFRVDVTGEYRGKANFHGLDNGHNSGGYEPDRYTGSKSELTFLLNGYVDLGTWSRFTPFVGAGVGFSRNTISNFGDVNVNACPGAGLCTSDVYADDASKWSFAWALYAGLAYKVTDNFTIELAYRYLDLGDGQTGNLHAYDHHSDASFTPYQFNHLTSQDIKLGVRFNFDAGYEVPAPAYYAPPPAYAPPPVYAPPPPPLRSRG